jgi:hypothetical protein
MLTGPDDTNRWDRVAALMAAGLGLHCVLAPAIASFVPALAGNAAHWVAAVAMLALSVPAIVQGLIEHHEWRVLGWAASAWALLGLARLRNEELGEAGEIVATTLAAALLVVAHQLNRSIAYWHNRK